MRVPLTVNDFLERATLAYGSRCVIIDEPDQPAAPLGSLTYREVGELAAAVVGARPSCWAIIAACTTWRSEGSMASGPPATGTCHTWVIIGVGP